jgi:hypothetical protein
MKTYFSLFLFCTLFLFPTFSKAQTEIFGTIKDATDSTGVPFATVILYPYQSSKILTYTQTDVDGNYKIKLKKTQVGILNLKANQLAYHSFSQDIVISDSTISQIPLSFFMEQNTVLLESVVVRSPVIVKKDTIIYDIEHFRKEGEQTLEDVLIDLPGFKILGNGDIQVNGRKIDKVLINGEEVTDGGSAIITRSLSADNVKSVEVRFDEKNDKLKESLLDSRDYVVLDIQLDKDLNTSFFGKARATLGYQNDLQLGGYLNAFSLKSKFKTHIFAEHDNFGEQTISLEQIKNIGEEAVQKMFDTPADFVLLTQREAFQDELFGFRNYTLSRKDIVGISTKLTVSPSLDIYFGSYNSYNKDGKTRSYIQNFESIGIENQLQESEQLSDYSTKNKLEIKFDKKNVKIKFNANAVLFKNDLTRTNSQITQNLENTNYNFGDVHKATNFYENLVVEWKASKKWSFHVKASHTYLSTNHNKTLNHNDSSYILFKTDLYSLNDTDNQFSFVQPISSTASSFISEGMAQYRSKLGEFRFGTRYHYREMASLREGFAITEQDNGNENTKIEIPIEEFIGQNNNWKTSQLMGFLNHRIGLGDFSFDNEIKFLQINYPSLVNNVSSEQKQTNLLAYKLNTSYSPMGSNLSVSYSKNISNFPLEKLVFGYELMDFQTVRLPANTPLIPQPEYSFMADAYKSLGNTRISAAFLYGKVQNGDRFLLPQNNLLYISQDQLSSEYLLFSSSVETSLKKFPLDLVLEPEYMVNKTENRLPTGEDYSIQTKRYLLGLKATTDFEETPFNVVLYPKYSAFIFQNDLSETQNRQDMASLDVSLRVQFFKDKLLFFPKLRTVHFTGGDINSTFTNIGFRLEAPISKFYCFLRVENVLNDTVFVRQFIYPTYFVNEQSSVFGRYFQIGIEYKWK